jgi:hypothetical protein
MYACYFTVSGSTVCVFVFEQSVLRHSSFVMLQCIRYHPFYFCFLVLYVLLYILCVLSSVLFLLMYISVTAFCIQMYGPLAAGGIPITVKKYRIESSRNEYATKTSELHTQSP